MSMTGDPDHQAQYNHQLGVTPGDRPRGVDRVGAGFRPSTTIEDDFKLKASVIKLKKIKLHPPLERIDSEAGPSDRRSGDLALDAGGDLEEWQARQQMAEGVKIGARLSQDLDIVGQTTVHRAKEKGSWAGIAPMVISNLEPDRQYKKIKSDKEGPAKAKPAPSSAGGQAPAPGQPRVA